MCRRSQSLLFTLLHYSNSSLRSSAHSSARFARRSSLVAGHELCDSRAGNHPLRSRHNPNEQEGGAQPEVRTATEVLALYSLLIEPRRKRLVVRFAPSNPAPPQVALRRVQREPVDTVLQQHPGKNVRSARRLLSYSRIAAEVLSNSG